MRKLEKATMEYRASQKTSAKIASEQLRRNQSRAQRNPDRVLKARHVCRRGSTRAIGKKYTLTEYCC